MAPMLAPRVLAVATALVLASGCEAERCTPGRSVACTGVGGCAGHQLCEPSGQAFSLCRCAVDTDAGAGDAMVRADITVHLDAAAVADTGVTASDAGGPDLGSTDAAAPAAAAPDASPPDTGTPNDVDCPALPPSAGNVVDIAAGDVTALVSAVDDATSGDVIRLADGTYDLNGRYLWFDVPNVTMRSASGDRAAVILDGGYSTTEIVTIAASDVTVADVTLERAFTHGVHVVGGRAGHIHRARIYNVHVLDPGEHAIKINQTGTNYADDGEIVCSRLELTDRGRAQVRNNCYTGGIDAHQTRGWQIRDNWIEGFWCSAGLSEHGIHMWRSNADTLIERNRIKNCGRGIGLGLTTRGIPDERTHADIDCQTMAHVDDYRGVVRNNFIVVDDPRIFSSSDGFDNGISVWAACQATVVHNTVFSTEAPFSSIEWRFAGTSGLVANNLVSHNIRERTTNTAVSSGNRTGATASDFADVGAVDLHLVAGASAIDAGDILTPGVCDEDIDGDARSSPPDVGADER